MTTSAAFKQFGQNGESIAGKSRCIQLDAQLNPYDRATTISVADGHLFVEGGVGVGGAVTLLYGLDQQCANKPMDLHLKKLKLDRFRIDFDLLDLPLAGAVVVWSPSGISSIPICVEGITPGVGFSCDMLFSDFAGEADFDHIQYIAIVLNSAGAIFSHGYGIRSIRAVLDPDAPAGQHPWSLPEPAFVKPLTKPALTQRGR